MKENYRVYARGSMTADPDDNAVVDKKVTRPKKVLGKLWTTDHETDGKLMLAKNNIKVKVEERLKKLREKYRI